MANSPSGCTSHCQPAPTELKLYQAFIFSTPILFTLVLLLLFYMLYLRRRRTAWAASQIRAQFLARGYISAPSERGLNKSFRERLPTIVFNENFVAVREDTQCAVCLGDYQMNEKLQHLPVCGHAFHLDCIDQWLANNTTCPLCRTSLLQASKVVPLDLAAHIATPQQAHESVDVPAHSSLPHEVHLTENVPMQESSRMLDLTREEQSRPIDEGTCEATHSINSDMHEVETSGNSPMVGCAGVKLDYVIS